MNPGVPTGTPDDSPPFRRYFTMLDSIFYIDAAYLSIISKHFGNGQYLNIDNCRFGINLCRSKNLWLSKTFYYTAPPFQSDPVSPDEALRRARYDKYINNLRKIPNFTVREGRCQKVDGNFHQKGVDTLITMDLFQNCLEGNINHILILTCDTDFVPILNRLRKDGIYVILVYYNDYIRHSSFSMSNHLLTACDDSILLDEEIIKRSIYNPLAK